MGGDGLFYSSVGWWVYWAEVLFLAWLCSGEIAYANRPPSGVTQNRAVGIRYLTCDHGSALPVVADVSIWGQIKIQEASAPGATLITNEILL